MMGSAAVPNATTAGPKPSSRGARGRARGAVRERVQKPGPSPTWLALDVGPARLDAAEARLEVCVDRGQSGRARVIWALPEKWEDEVDEARR